MYKDNNFNKWLNLNILLLDYKNKLIKEMIK